MADRHTATLRLLDIKATQRGWRLLPYFVGGAWLGQLTRDWRSSRGLSVELAHAVRVTLGRPGVFDRVGWRPVVITPDMVGLTLAQFVTVDAKTPAYKRMSAEQRNYARAVREDGGFAALALRVGDEVAIAEIGEDL